MKRFALWVIVIFIGVPVAVYFIATFSGYVDTLRLQKPAIADEVFQCTNSNLSWKVQHLNLVQSADYGIDNPHPARPYTITELTLWNKSQKIATLAPGASSENTFQADQTYFPLGQSFTQVYILNPAYKKPLVTDFGMQYLGIEVPASKITPEDFDAAVHCFANQFSNTIFKQRVGRFMRVDDKIVHDSYLYVPEFTCSDGRHAYTSGDVDFLAPGVTNKMATESGNGRTTIGRIGIDGKVYAEHSNQEVQLPNVQCKDSDGVTLQDYISSIPNRITFLTN